MQGWLQALMWVPLLCLKEVQEQRQSAGVWPGRGVEVAAAGSMWSKREELLPSWRARAATAAAGQPTGMEMKAGVLFVT
jgi:hypothetical protein